MEREGAQDWLDRYVEAGYMYPGGNAVNVAVHARRNGATSAYLGAVGTDRAGQVVLAALEWWARTIGKDRLVV